MVYTNCTQLRLPAEDDSVLEDVLVGLPLGELLAEDGLDPGLHLGLRRVVALAQHLKDCKVNRDYEGNVNIT